MILRGTNLGNWLIIEAWMLGWDIEDQETLFKVLTVRFGKSEADRLMTIYRDGYITPRDFELIKSFGCNLVRLPFDCRMLIDEDGNLRPDAFKYLDRGLDMAEKAGVYVILDMHGAPGGQSKMDHTGKRDINQLWSSPKLKNQMVQLWRTIAERYKSRAVVAAYDLLNEPYGDYQTDMRPALRELIPRCYQAIRSTGNDTIVIFPNALGAGITFYGDLKSKGFKQIAFTDHYYAGLFGSPSTLQSHAGVFGRTVPEAQTYLSLNDAAMLIGEFNVVQEKAGGDAVMRRYYDEFAKRGWMATMWSYKLLKTAGGVQPDNWYLVTNAQPLPAIDVRKSSHREIEAYFEQLATMPLVADEALKAALTSPTPPSILLPIVRPLPTVAPTDRRFENWSLVDVNTTMKAGLIKTTSGISVISAGTDIFGGSDSFAYLQQPAPPKALLSDSINSLLDSSMWSKAGLMVRFGNPGSETFSGAPFAMVNAFSDGTIAFLYREAQGVQAREIKRYIGPLPYRLAIGRDKNQITAYAETAPDIWIQVGRATIRSDKPAQIGLATSSNSQTLLTKADFSRVSLSSATKPQGKIANVAQASLVSKANLLQDPNFERISTGRSSWNQWGNAVTSREGVDGVTVRPGAGLWQDVAVKQGNEYSFEIRVRRPDGAPASNVALSFEAVAGGKLIAITDQNVNTSTIETGTGWSVIRVSAVAVTSTMRVLIRTSSIDNKEATSIDISGASMWRSKR
jgi:glucan 1,3-beta-glucosidase